MFKKFLPKEEKYFDDFQSMISTISDMTKISLDFFTEAKYDEESVFKVRALESRCDEIFQKVMKKLNKSFLTPFDREDIYDLMRSCEKLSDTLQAAVTRVHLYNVVKPIEAAKQLLQIGKMQVKELYDAIVDIKLNHTGDLKTVKDLEQEADIIYRNAVSLLFKEEKNAIELIKVKEILDVLEEFTDRCKNVASVILTISLKNN